MSDFPVLDFSVLDSVKKIDEQSVDLSLRTALAALDRKIVVLDDDPTGVQTVHGISVYTSWDRDAVEAGFAEPGSMFFVLTNSRSFTAEETRKAHIEMADNIAAAAKKTGKKFIVISRGDSTMRGHFPLETETLRTALEKNTGKAMDGEIIFPFFKEGGRFTIGNVHYVKETSGLVPAGSTEFAKDKTFGYRSSHLGEWVEEKTKGQFAKDSCSYVSLDDLRSFAVDKIALQLKAVSSFNKVIVNAVDYVDVKVFMLAFVKAVLSGKEFVFRSAAAVTKVLGGVSDRPLLTKSELVEKGNKNGGIVLIGSHVNKTTQQFEALRELGDKVEFIEFDQHLVLKEGGLEGEVARVIDLAEKNILLGKNVVVYTRRERFDLDTDDKEKQLVISVKISDAVTSIIGKLNVRPSYIIAKGGITSSDVGTKALRVKKALVMGQIKPGIPVWMTGSESKFPEMPYIIFPGNVGEVDTLKKIVEELSFL